ncbi:MAG: hypothetical protein FGM47_03745 [Candidatus Nanopelagicaceae bacterium]|nr:hypothetical protein [Candidatus Nanopelagicaceae bacterium]
MRNSFKFIGKGATLLAASSLLMAMTAVIPAEAANKAGASCTKANAKTKIGGDSYVCTKNPTVKKAKLTWVWVGCIESNKLYLESNARLKTITESAAQAVTMLDTEIAALKAEAPKDEADAKVFDQKAADAKVKQAAALADAKLNTDNATKVGATTAAGKQYTTNAATWTKAARSYELAAKNFERSAASLRDKINEVAKKEKQKLNVLQTVENSKVEVSSTLQNRKNACKPGL